MSAPDRRALVDRGVGRPSIRRQCALLGVARSAVYRPPRPANDNDLLLMRRLDELFTAWPFLGSRRMTGPATILRGESFLVMSALGSSLSVRSGSRNGSSRRNLVIRAHPGEGPPS